MSGDEAADFVIIGAGSAGCVVAHRLVTTARGSVLVLESGGVDTDPALHEPAMWALTLGTEADWSYRTGPQQHAAGREIPWPRGKVVGGSSSINAMVWVRGQPQDYDSWERRGADGWAFADVLDAFKELERFPGGDPVYRGQSGPLHVTTPSAVSEFAQAAYDAAVEWGAVPNDDPNGQAQEGVAWNQMTVVDGRRHSAASAFLHPMSDDPALVVRVGAHATRLVLDDSRAVVAVEYLHDGTPRRCWVREQVFLTAGAIESPKLLMLSGIGPAGHLRDHGIEVALGLDGVGENLHDHPGVPVVFEARKPVPFGPNQGSELAIFCRSSPEATVPDIQFGVLNLAIADDPSVLPANAFMFYPSLLKPASRGTVRLASASPLDHPLIDPAYLREPQDVDGLVRAVEISRELAATETLRSWTAAEFFPGAQVDDRPGLADHVRASVNTWFHPVGTCRMGTDSGAVVDPALLVHGVRNLRVADASVMPEITAGNTNAPTMMIAWRAVEMAVKG